MTYPSDSVDKESAFNARDAGLIPGLGRSPRGGHGNPLKYSCLENPMDRGDWWATVLRVAKSWIQLKGLNTHKWGYLVFPPLSLNLSFSPVPLNLTAHCSHLG